MGLVLFVWAHRLNGEGFEGRFLITRLHLDIPERFFE